MLVKVKNCFQKAIFTLGMCSIAVKTASAEGGVATQTAETVSSKIVDTVGGVLQPIGGAILFVTVAVCALQIIIAANNPEGRARALAAMPYIIGGGILLGGALMVAGFILNMSQGLNV